MAMQGASACRTALRRPGRPVQRCKMNVMPAQASPSGRHLALPAPAGLLPLSPTARVQVRAMLLAALLVPNAAAMARDPVQVDFRCLSTGGDRPIRLEWRVFSEAETDWTAAYVRYKGARRVIPLVLRSSAATQMQAGRPAEFKSVWLEVVAGKVAGEYDVTSQGANIYGFVYKNYQSGKEVSFAQDPDAMKDADCQWH